MDRGAWQATVHGVAKETQFRDLQNCNEIPHQPECLSSKNLQTVNAVEDEDKREPFYTVDRNVNWYSHYAEQYADSLKN